VALATGNGIKSRSLPATTKEARHAASTREDGCRGRPEAQDGVEFFRGSASSRGLCKGSGGPTSREKTKSEQGRERRTEEPTDAKARTLPPGWKKTSHKWRTTTKQGPLNVNGDRKSRRTLRGTEIFRIAGVLENGRDYAKVGESLRKGFVLLPQGN